MENLFLGIDLGTSSVKLAVQNVNEKYIYETTVSYEYDQFDNQWTEINPDVWWKVVFNQLQIIFSFSWSNRIVGLALTGQMHTTVFVDENGKSVRNALMWNDKRTLESISEIKRSLNKNESTKVNGQIVAPGSPLANLLWLRENEPNNFARINKFLIGKDYINYKLTDNIATDYCDASTSAMYDFNEEGWSSEVIELFDIPKKIYPKIVSSGTKLGVIKSKLKERLKIEQDIDVFVGTGDNAATYFASESFNSQDILISIGTSGVTLLPGDRNNLSTSGKNIAFKLFDDDQYMIIQGSISTGGKALSWWIDEILETEDIVAEQAEIDKETLIEADEIFIPYMTGEKYLYKNNSFKGTFLNVTPLTSRKRMTLSVLEGIAFAIKDLSEKLTHESFDGIKIIGGGAKSPLWKKIFASIFQESIKDYSNTANAVNGAIKIAKAGYYNKYSPGCSSYSETFAEDEILNKIYTEKYKRYLAAVNTLDLYYKEN